MKRILVTGATGQIGSELTMALRYIYGGGGMLLRQGIAGNRVLI